MKKGGHETVHLVVADGNIEIHKNAQGQHVENLQEIFTSKVVLAELLTALKALAPGGHFVCKIYDTFSHITQSMIYICVQAFKDVTIVKPIRSRIVNSERYLVCKFFKKDDDKVDLFIEILKILLSKCSDNATPQSCLPIESMKRDALFMRTTRAMTNDIAVKQTRALQVILDSVQRKLELRDRGLAAYPYTANS